MISCFPKFDFKCNFCTNHYIKVDAPALQIEEVAPALASGASRKAPEEVFAGGDGKGGVRGGAGGDVKVGLYKLKSVIYSQLGSAWFQPLNLKCDLLVTNFA